MRLNAAKNSAVGELPCFLTTGRSSVTHSAGVRVRATSTESTIAATMVIENWR